MKHDFDMGLDRTQRASVEAIKESVGLVKLEAANLDGSLFAMNVFGDRQLRHDIALAYQSYFNRENRKIERNG